MKRALFVGAGTVAGVVAALSYTPATGVVSADGGAPARHADASGKSDSGGRQGQGAAKDQDKPVKKTEGSGAGGAKPGKQTTPSGPSGSGSTAGSRTSGSGSGAATSGGSGSKPQPTKSSGQTPGPKPSPSKSPDPKPVTYLGAVASTPFGPVQVQITVLSGKITDAQAVQYPHADAQSTAIASSALPKLRSETLSAQSASIATVSGATFTSNGWISSLQSALAKAGL